MPMTDSPDHEGQMGPGPVQSGEETPTWLEDPRFSLESLSPGQRYTALIVAGLIACMLAFGINRSSSGSNPPAGSPVTGTGAGSGVGAASAGPASAPDSGASAAAGTGLSSASASGGGTSTLGAGANPQAGATSPAAQGTAQGSGGAAAAGPGASGHPTSTPGSANGGATFRGVTASKVTIGMVNLDSSSLAPVCPRCGNGAGADGAAADALVAAWRKDGLLPVNGRDFNVVNIKYNVLNSEEERSACLQMAQNVHPFFVGGVSMGGGLGQCLAQQNHLLIMDGETSGDQAFMATTAPYAWSIQPVIDRVWRNYPIWLSQHGLLKGQVLGLYSPDDSVVANEQEDLNKSLRAGLHQLGYKLAVDMTYGQTPNDALAVERFHTAGVTVALIIGQLTEPAGFQNVAEQQGYRPKYPVAETANEMTDAVADVTYNANAENGSTGMKTQFWDWSARQPATALNNAQASYCIKAYQDYTHRSLDVYTNDAEIHYLFEICSILQVARAAIVKAGPDLTQNTFVAALEQIKGLQTAYESSVTYTAAKPDGADDFADAQFDKARWQPSNDYWKVVGRWTPYYVP